MGPKGHRPSLMKTWMATVQGDGGQAKLLPSLAKKEPGRFAVATSRANENGSWTQNVCLDLTRKGLGHTGLSDQSAFSF